METPGHAPTRERDEASRKGAQRAAALAVLGLVLAVPGLVTDLGGLRRALLFLALAFLVASATLRAITLHVQNRLDPVFTAVAATTAVCCLLLGFGWTSEAGTNGASATDPPGNTSAGTGAPSRATTPPGDATPEAPGVYKNGLAQVEIDPSDYYASDSFDLDQWVASHVGNLFDRDFDITVNQTTLSGMNGALITSAKSASYDDCRAALGRGRPTAVPLADLGVDSTVCVRTSDGRTAAVVVTRMPSNADNPATLEFSATVWNDRQH